MKNGGKPESEKPFWEKDLLQLPFLARVLEKDLFTLPGLRGWRERMDCTVMANSRARREAKAILFSELAASARLGVPLETALRICARTAEQAGLGRSAPRQSGFGEIILSLVVGLFQLFWFVLTLPWRAVHLNHGSPFSPWPRRTERVALALARRLHARVVKGLPLSEAMKDCAPDYSKQEILLARSGERWSVLPQTLKRLAEVQAAESLFSVIQTYLLYPIVLAVVALSILSFILVVIIPKFQDIFQQLGAAELPALTQAFVDSSYLISHSPVLPCVALIVLFFLARSLLSGGPIARLFLGVMLSALAAVGVLIGFVSFEKWPGYQLSYGIAFAAVTLGVILFGMPKLLGLLERIVLAVERAGASVARWLPLSGLAARVREEAAWLASLSVALSAGAPAPDALRAAGEICGGRAGKRSAAAAEMVERGRSIGEACVAQRVLRKQTNHRLAALDGRVDYVEELGALARFGADEAGEALVRNASIAEVVCHAAVALVIGVSVVAIYLPLFMIPRIMMAE